MVEDKCTHLRINHMNFTIIDTVPTSRDKSDVFTIDR